MFLRRPAAWKSENALIVINQQRITNYDNLNLILIFYCYKKFIPSVKLIV